MISESLTLGLMYLSLLTSLFVFNTLFLQWCTHARQNSQLSDMTGFSSVNVIFHRGHTCVHIIQLVHPSSTSIYNFLTMASAIFSMPRYESKRFFRKDIFFSGFNVIFYFVDLTIYVGIFFKFLFLGHVKSW